MAEKTDIQEIQKTWTAFMSQFGNNDIYTNIVLEEFFFLLCEKQDIELDKIKESPNE